MLMTCMHVLRYLLPVCLLTLLVSACEIEGGVAPPTTPGAAQLPTPTSSPTVQPTTTLAPDTASTPQATATSAVTSRGPAFQIGLIDEPADLLAYHTNAVDERVTAPVSELLFPAPLLPVDYSYTTTAVLERMPSFANGDIELRLVDVYLDASGVITTTETDVITDAQQIVITYRWNSDLRWSDDEALTAADSLFAYELAQRVDLGEAANERLRLTESYEQVDEYTTRAFLKPDLPDINQGATDSPVNLDLTNTDYMLTYWPPLPLHVLGGRLFEENEFFAEDFALLPVSYGPYMVTDRVEGRSIRLDRNPYYAATDELPAADVVSFVFFDDVEEMQTALRNGSIDVAVVDNPDLAQLDFLDSPQDADAIETYYVANPIWEHLDFNLDFPLLDDKRARHAIAYGTNRESMVDALFGGHVPVLDSWIVPGHWAAAPADELTRYPYDPERARELLDELNLVDLDEDGIREQGIDHDSDGTLESSVPITLTLRTTTDTPLRSEITRRFQQDMEDIGLRVTVLETPVDELFSFDGPLFRREFELAQFAWIASPNPRGFELWSCTAVPDVLNNWSGSNLPGWCFREANNAIITATTALDLQERRAAYIEHQRIFSEELPVLPLFQRMTVVLASPTLVGLRPDPVAPITWNIAEWSRE